jgi:2-polyprenyl-6-methoxyphenol hydroxylase-like FAD-dependent oxidoreductase
MIRCDALVAGAGPAGSIAALELSRAGLRVVVADRMDQSTPKIGESLPGVGLRLLRSLRVDVSEFGTAHRKIGGNMTCWGAEELEATDFIADPDGPGWRLSRHRFDSQLLAAARQAGALHSAFHVDLVARQSETWECRTSPGESITARWLIDATGRSSHIARRLGVQRVRDEGLVALCGFSLIHPDPPSDRTLIDAVPEGWWYGATLPDKTPLLVWHVRPQDARAARQDWFRRSAARCSLRLWPRTLNSARRCWLPRPEAAALARSTASTGLLVATRRCRSIRYRRKASTPRCIPD